MMDKGRYGSGAVIDLGAGDGKIVIAAAKARPGQMAYASGGNGTILQMQAELLAQRTGVKFIHVPYRGDTPALQDTLGGQVQFMFVPSVKSPKIHP